MIDVFENGLKFRQNYRSIGHVCYNTCIRGDVIYLCSFCGTRDDFFQF